VARVWEQPGAVNHGIRPLECPAEDFRILNVPHVQVAGGKVDVSRIVLGTNQPTYLEASLPQDMAHTMAYASGRARDQHSPDVRRRQQH
jgi:hypothetical protein